MAVASVLLVTAAAYAAVRLRPRERLRVLSGVGDRALQRLGLGTIIGSGLFLLVLGIVMAMGGITIARRPSLPSGIPAELVTIALFSVWEEYVFRGWAFSICVEALGPDAAALGLGVLFGVAHLGNPHPTALAIACVTSAGIFLGYAMLAARSILLPVGIHAGWNLAQTLLTSRRYVEVTLDPKAWLSGGAWGIEGSVAALAIMMGAAAIARAASRRAR